MANQTCLCSISQGRAQRRRDHHSGCTQGMPTSQKPAICLDFNLKIIWVVHLERVNRLKQPPQIPLIQRFGWKNLIHRRQRFSNSEQNKILFHHIISFLVEHLRSTGVKGEMDTMLLDGERKKLILMGEGVKTKTSVTESLRWGRMPSF